MLQHGISSPSAASRRAPKYAGNQRLYNRSSGEPYVSSATRLRVAGSSCHTAAAASTLPCECPEMMTRPPVASIQVPIRQDRSGTARSA